MGKRGEGGYREKSAGLGFRRAGFSPDANFILQLLALGLVTSPLKTLGHPSTLQGLGPHKGLPTRAF